MSLSETTLRCHDRIWNKHNYGTQSVKHVLGSPNLYHIPVAAKNDLDVHSVRTWKTSVLGARQLKRSCLESTSLSIHPPFLTSAACWVLLNISYTVNRYWPPRHRVIFEQRHKSNSVSRELCRAVSPSWFDHHFKLKDWADYWTTET